MKILCVYELKTRDCGWVKSFYPCRRFLEEFSARGVQIEFLFPEEACKFFKKSRAGFRKQGERKSLCLFRGPVPFPVIKSAEKAGFLCINTPESIKKASDKLICASLFSKNGIPSPDTLSANKAIKGLPRKIPGTGQKLSFPVVIKPRHGSRGENIFLAKNMEEMKDFFKTKSLKSGENINKSPAQYIAQQFVEYSCGRDLRVFFAGKKILVAAERINKGINRDNGEIRSNISTGGTFIPLGKDRETALLESIKDVMEKIYSVSGLFYGTADFLFKNEQELLLCEINSSPGFEGMEKQMGINIAGKLAEAFIQAAASIPGFQRPV